MTPCRRTGAGLPVFSDCVLDKAQMRRRLSLVGTGWKDLPGPNTLVALRKYSVPPRSVALDKAGAVAGQTVKPGFPSSSKAASEVSNWMTVTGANPAASARFEIA